MSTHNICFCGEIRKISILWIEKSALTSAMGVYIFFIFLHKIYAMGTLIRAEHF